VGIHVGCSVPLCVCVCVCVCVRAFYVVAMICRRIFLEHVLKEHNQ
jgi:hypothetical protein